MHRYKGTTIEDILILKQKVRNIFLRSKSQQEAYTKRDDLTAENWQIKNQHFANIIKFLNTSYFKYMTTFLDMGEQIKVLDIAKNLISLSGFTLGKDIEIKIIGMRPGEKLSEELILDKEKDKVTKHEKIYTNQPQELDKSLLDKKLKELKYLTDMMDNVEVVRKMKEIIKL